MNQIYCLLVFFFFKSVLYLSITECLFFFIKNKPRHRNEINVTIKLDTYNSMTSLAYQKIIIMVTPVIMVRDSFVKPLFFYIL